MYCIRLIVIIWVGIGMNALSICIQGQSASWQKLVPLESNRSDVERILGKPEVYFKTFGTYRTEFGKFSVWYSKGRCEKSVQDIQYDVPSGRFVGLIVYLNHTTPLENFIKDLVPYKKSESPLENGRYFYTDPDETTAYEVIASDRSKEFVYSISIEPGKDKKRFICKGK